MLEVIGDTFDVLVDGVRVEPPLTINQWRLVEHLDKNRGKVIERYDLMQVIWPDANLGYITDEALDAIVRRTRRKIGMNNIKTRRGIGYYIPKG